MTEQTMMLKEDLSIDEHRLSEGQVLEEPAVEKPKRKPAKKKKEINYKTEHKKALEVIEQQEEQIQLAQHKADILFKENRMLREKYGDIEAKYEMANDFLLDAVQNAFNMHRLALRK